MYFFSAKYQFLHIYIFYHVFQFKNSIIDFKIEIFVVNCNSGTFPITMAMSIELTIDFIALRFDH